MKFENLHKDRWVATIGRTDGMEALHDGKPWKVVAISWPFVILMDQEGKRQNADLRVWKFGYVNDEFVAASAAKKALPFGVDAAVPDRIAEGMCETCGGFFVERLDGDEWRYYCRECERFL